MSAKNDLQIIRDALEAMKNDSHYPAYAQVALDALEKLEDRLDPLPCPFQSDGKHRCTDCGTTFPEEG